MARGAVQGAHQVPGGEGRVDHAPVAHLDRQVEPGYMSGGDEQAQPTIERADDPGDHGIEHTHQVPRGRVVDAEQPPTRIGALLALFAPDTAAATVDRH